MTRKQAIMFIAFVVALVCTLVALSFIGADKNTDNDSGSSASKSPRPIATGKLAGFYNQTLQWKSCNDGFDCATLSVPLDYANPQTESIAIQLVRHKALRVSQGALVVNPGGPGGSGIEYARAIDYIMSPELIDSFDVIGFDPRGVGSSTPVECLGDSEIDRYINTDQSPDNQAEIDSFIEVSKQLGEGPARSSRVNEEEQALAALAAEMS